MNHVKHHEHVYGLSYTVDNNTVWRHVYFSRWVMRRMNMEFAEMLQTTTGKLLDQITVSKITQSNH